MLLPARKKLVVLGENKYRQLSNLIDKITEMDYYKITYKIHVFGGDFYEKNHKHNMRNAYGCALCASN